MGKIEEFDRFVGNIGRANDRKNNIITALGADASIIAYYRVRQERGKTAFQEEPSFDLDLSDDTRLLARGRQYLQSCQTIEHSNLVKSLNAMRIIRDEGQSDNALTEQQKQYLMTKYTEIEAMVNG